MDVNGNPVMNYYQSLIASTTNLTDEDINKLIKMNNEADFDFCPVTRDELVMCVKYKAS